MNALMLILCAVAIVLSIVALVKSSKVKNQIIAWLKSSDAIELYQGPKGEQGATGLDGKNGEKGGRGPIGDKGLDGTCVCNKEVVKELVEEYFSKCTPVATKPKSTPKTKKTDSK